MNEHLHPVMREALAAFVGTNSLPPRRQKTTQTFFHAPSNTDIELQCEIEYEAGERQTWDHPGCAPSASLCEAFHRGEDIKDLLSPNLIEAIEVAFLEQEVNGGYDDPPNDGFAPDETSFG